MREKIIFSFTRLVIFSALIYLPYISHGGDFTLSVIHSDRMVSAGYSTAFDVLVEPVSGATTESVTLSVSGLPPDIGAYNFSPPDVTPRGYSVLAIGTLEATTPGTYTLTIQGTDNGSSPILKQTQATLNIVDDAYVCPEFPFPQNCVGSNRVLGYLVGLNTPGSCRITKDPEGALGLPDSINGCLGRPDNPPPTFVFYSTGLGGGYIELGLEGGSIIDQPGTDFILVEVGSWDVRMESAEVTINGVTKIIDQDYFSDRLFVYIPLLCTDPFERWVSLYNVDLADFGTTQADRLKIADASGKFTSDGTAGFDLDGIAVLPYSYGSALDCQAVIKSPKQGKKVSGNRVTVFGKIQTGQCTIDASILFQYRCPSVIGSWTDIPPASSQYPNPDASHPYFVHWDISAMSEGMYDLRAVYECGDYSDPDPAYITVEIKHSNADHNSGLDVDGKLLVNEVLAPSSKNEITAADTNTGALAELIINTSKTIGGSPSVTLKFHEIGDFPSLAQFAGGASTGPGLEITLYGATIIDANDTGLLTLSLSYPDGDDDGFVDGKNMAETSLNMYRFDGVSTEGLSSSVDPINNLAVGVSGQNSVFAVIGEIQSNIYDWSLY